MYAPRLPARARGNISVHQWGLDALLFSQTDNPLRLSTIIDLEIAKSNVIKLLDEF